MPIPPVNPPTPSSEPDYVVGAKRTTDSTSSSTSGILVTGDHVVSSNILKVNKEWQPKDKAAQRFKDSIVKYVEQILNNTSSGSGPIEDPDDETGGSNPGGGTTPDLFYDTGYFYIKCKLVNPGHNSWYVDKTHNLGQVPSRFSVFYTNDPTLSIADPNSDYRWVAPCGIRDYNDHWVGFQILIKTANKVQIQAPGDRLIQTGTSNPIAAGYLRVMMWK